VKSCARWLFTGHWARVELEKAPELDFASGNPDDVVD